MPLGKDRQDGRTTDGHRWPIDGGTSPPAHPQETLRYRPSAELDRYLNAEKRDLVQAVENLWDKYAVSSRQLESEQDRDSQDTGRLSKRIGVCG